MELLRLTEGRHAAMAHDLAKLYLQVCNVAEIQQNEIHMLRAERNALQAHVDAINFALGADTILHDFIDKVSPTGGLALEHLAKASTCDTCRQATYKHDALRRTYYFNGQVLPGCPTCGRS